MGQCSTLPSEGRSAARHGNQENNGPEYADRTPLKPSHAKRNGYLQVTVPQNGNSPASPPFAPQFNNMQYEKIQPQARQPDYSSTQGESVPSEPMQEDSREGTMTFPSPPENAKRTRCYKLNLESEHVGTSGQSSHLCLGPFTEPVPPLTYSSSEDSASQTNPTKVAIQTAQIFRGITVGKDGTILSQNARATRSSRGNKNKRGEKSRQATKIDKAKDLVEEAVLTGKAPDSDDPANMISLVIMGEYDDMKYLVRDGSKKLRDASGLPDEALLAINRPRESPRVASSSMSATLLSPRKRVSPNVGRVTTPNKSRPPGLPQSAPPKLKGHPRDIKTGSRRLSQDSEKSRQQAFAAQKDAATGFDSRADSDWSNFSRGFQFNSIWNCGGTGDESGTISPTHGKDKAVPGPAVSPQRQPVFEGRDTAHTRVREGGLTNRAN